MPGDRRWTDTDVQAGARAVTAALGDRPWRTMTPRRAAIAVLDALTAAGWDRAARVRAEVAEELRGLAEYHDPADRLALHSAAEHITARATLTGEDHPQ